MSMTRMLSAAAAAAAILALPALAAGATQSQMSPDSMSAPTTDRDDASMPPPSAPAADNAGMNTSATTLDASQVTPDQATALRSGDNTLVTNGPVPDTAANRARYGKPMSHAGKRTAPAGN